MKTKLWWEQVFISFQRGGTGMVFSLKIYFLLAALVFFVLALLIFFILGCREVPILKRNQARATFHLFFSPTFLSRFFFCKRQMKGKEKGQVDYELFLYFQETFGKRLMSQHGKDNFPPPSVCLWQFLFKRSAGRRLSFHAGPSASVTV